jgi:putative membrane protein
MKLFRNEVELNAKAKLTLALCTVLALSMASLRAQDDKDKSQGGAGADTPTQTGQGKLSSTDEQFVRNAAKSGILEVRVAKMGVQKAQNPSVKQLAQRLVDDHTKVNSELKQLAMSKGLTLPDADRITGVTPDTDSDRTQVRERTGTASDDAAHKAHIEALKKLESLSGTEFDSTWLKTIVTHHEKSVSAYEKASQSATDQQVKSFAAKTLPTIKDHLSQAKSLQSQTGATGAPGTDAGTDTGKSKQNNSEPARQQN